MVFVSFSASLVLMFTAFLCFFAYFSIAQVAPLDFNCRFPALSSGKENILGERVLERKQRSFGITVATDCYEGPRPQKGGGVLQFLMFLTIVPMLMSLNRLLYIDFYLLPFSF